MIRKITLENYMAHVHTEIEPAEGLTVLIGPNNCGKSAIIHALEMICYNSDAADYAIRHGAKKAIVTIETEDEDGTRHEIVWWRKKSSAGYEIDGRSISRLGRSSVPDDLHEYLRMPKIESAAGDREFLLHFGLQKLPVFLLDDPPSRAAQFFASSTDATHLVQMQKAHQQKVANARRDRQKLEQQLGCLDGQLESLSPLEDLSTRMTAVHEEYRRLVALAGQIDALSHSVTDSDRGHRAEREGLTRVSALHPLASPPALHEIGGIAQQIRATESFLAEASLNGSYARLLRALVVPPAVTPTSELLALCTDFTKAARRHAHENARLGVLVQLPTAPALDDTSALHVAIVEVARSVSQVGQLDRRRLALSWLGHAPPMTDTSDLSEALQALGRQSHQLERYESEFRVVETVPPAPSLGDTKELEDQVTQIARAAAAYQIQGRRVEALGELLAAPELLDTSPLRSLIKQIETSGEESMRQRSMLKQASDLLHRFHLEMEQWLSQNPRCSACGQPVTEELVLSGGHSHE